MKDISLLALKALSEQEFQDSFVLPLANRCGWLNYHTYDSRRSTPGFPDLIMLREGAMVVAELKSEKGRLSADQKMWLESFRNLARKSDRVSVHMWRPSDWPEVQRILNKQRG